MFKTKLHILTGVGAFLFLLFYTLSCGINNNKDTENTHNGTGNNRDGHDCGSDGKVRRGISKHGA